MKLLQLLSRAITLQQTLKKHLLLHDKAVQHLNHLRGERKNYESVIFMAEIDAVRPEHRVRTDAAS